MQPSPNAGDLARDAARLEELAAALTAHGFKANLLTSPADAPRLDVANPRASALSDTVYAANGWFWWSWAERISPISDVSAAAHKVAAVLHAAPEPA